MTLFTNTETFTPGFQSTHPRRVWLALVCCYLVLFVFQSTHPRRVWLPERDGSMSWACFNPHTHEGCDPLQLAPYQDTRQFQSTHPRRVWLVSAFARMPANIVSIHTPTKGVTLRPRTCRRASAVSIHTPTKGVTALQVLFFNDILFQSTHPRRVWLFITFVKIKFKMFQSTHPRRVWLSWNLNSTLSTLFQSTHPRRVWLFWTDGPTIQQVVSIHTPTKGVTG